MRLVPVVALMAWVLVPGGCAAPSVGTVEEEPPPQDAATAADTREAAPAVPEPPPVEPARDAPLPDRAVDAAAADAAAEAVRRDAPADLAPDLPPNLGPEPVWIGPQLVVAVGNDGRRVVSRDGISWTGDMRDVTGNKDGPKTLRALAYGDNLVVAVGGSCTPVCSARLASFDGRTWTEIELPEGVGRLTGVAHGNGVFAVVGDYGPVVRGLHQGRLWSRTLRVITGIQAVRFGKVGDAEVFVAVGDGNLRMRSTDGLNWTDMQRAGALAESYRAVAIGGGVAVAVGGGGRMGRRIRTTDGVTWTDELVGGPELESVVYAEGRFLAYTASGDAVLISPDGKAWTTQTARNAAGAVAYGSIGGPKLFVGRVTASTSWAIRTSMDGLSWTNRLSAMTGDATLHAFVFAGPPGGGVMPDAAPPDGAGAPGAEAPDAGAAVPGDASDPD